MNTTLQTPRLILRKLNEADADAVFLWCGDSVVNEYMMYSLHKNTDETKDYLKSLDPEDPDDFDMGFVLKETGELIGAGGLVFKPEPNTWIVGYNLRADQWGNGYVVEALQAILEHVRKTRTVRSIEATIAIDNTRSIRVAEKLGMSGCGDTTYQKLDGSRSFHARIYRREFT